MNTFLDLTSTLSGMRHFDIGLFRHIHPRSPNCYCSIHQKKKKIAVAQTSIGQNYAYNSLISSSWLIGSFQNIYIYFFLAEFFFFWVRLNIQTTIHWVRYFHTNCPHMAQPSRCLISVISASLDYKVIIYCIKYKVRSEACGGYWREEKKKKTI